MKCIVGMSGGVDSSVVAAILKSHGVQVIGCTLKMFDSAKTDQAICDAQNVAKFLGVEHEVIDCSQRFSKQVQQYFIDSYFCGQTPNPCVRCNEVVKFAVLNEIRQRYGAEYLATGHYARLIHYPHDFSLKRAIDLRKDQSYFLYRVSSDILMHTLFVLGYFFKEQVRQIAADMAIPVATKTDSQDICFVTNDYEEFLHTNHHSIAGDIINESGQVLGHHNGVEHYTVGQRKGLGLSGGPFFVKSIDAVNHKIIVASKHDVEKSNVILKDVKFFTTQYEGVCEVKLRAASSLKLAEISKHSNDQYIVQLKSPEFAVSPGQHCAFYIDDTIIGGGVIVE